MTRARKTAYTQLCHHKAAVLAASLLLGYAQAGLAQAGQTERVIFSAENALYGAGYDIGRADGWFDNDLRNAVRTYQKASGLAVNGNLDNPTLSALGVTATPVQSISDNALGSPAQSVKVLGLASPARKPLPQPAAQKAVVEKTVAPQPTVDVKTVEKAVVEKEVVVEKKAVSEKSDDTEGLVQTANNDQRKEQEKQIVKAETSTEPEDPSPTPIAENTVDPTPAAVASSESTTAEPVEAPQPVSKSVEQPTPVPAKPQKDVTVAEPSEPQAPAEPRSASSGGGFFSALFDFFFGWLV